MSHFMWNLYPAVQNQIQVSFHSRQQQHSVCVPYCWAIAWHFKQINIIQVSIQDELHVTVQAKKKLWIFYSDMTLNKKFIDGVLYPVHYIEFNVLIYLINLTLQTLITFKFKCMQLLEGISKYISKPNRVKDKSISCCHIWFRSQRIGIFQKLWFLGPIHPLECTPMYRAS